MAFTAVNLGILVMCDMTLYRYMSGSQLFTLSSRGKRSDCHIPEHLNPQLEVNYKTSHTMNSVSY
jgi:hypothetical protein